MESIKKPKVEFHNAEFDVFHEATIWLEGWVMDTEERRDWFVQRAGIMYDQGKWKAGITSVKSSLAP